MKASFIYDQGTSPRREDGFIVGDGIFGVLDGVTMPHSPKYPATMFQGLSGGEMVVRTCERLFSPTFFLRVGTKVDDALRTAVLTINEEVGRTQWGFDLPLNDAGKLAGATFAFAHLTPNYIDIVQAGVCMVIVEFTDDMHKDILVSPNQVRAHDTAMNAEIERIQREVAQELLGLELEEVPDDRRKQVRDEMWDRFYSTLVDARRRDANQLESPQGYGVLNGQLELQDMLWVQRFPREEVTTLLLFSDGIVPWSVMKRATDIEVGRTILEGFQNYGLHGVLTQSRRTEESFAKISYENQPEATAIALVL